MKTQMLLAVLGLLAAYVSSAAVEPVQVAELATLERAEVPVQIIESFEEFNLDDGSIGPVARSTTLLFSETVIRSAIANIVQIVTVRYTGRAATLISSVAWTHWGTQTARITAGGLNSNTITVEIRSAAGRGINTQIEVWGRY